MTNYTPTSAHTQSSVSLTLLIVGISIISLVSYVLNKKRLGSLQKYAESNGFTYAPTTDSLWLTIIDTAPFNVAEPAYRKKAKESLTFEYKNKPGAFFDYQYITGNGKTRSVHDVKIAFIYTGINKSRITLSSHSLIKETLLSKTEVKFEDPEFNKRFSVQSHDPKFAYDTLTPETLKVLKSHGLSGLIWDNDYLMYHEIGTWKPADIGSAFTALKEIVDQTPKFLVADSAPLADNVYLPSDKNASEIATNYDKRQAEVEQIETHDPDPAEIYGVDSYQADAFKKTEAIKKYENSGADDSKLTEYDLLQRKVEHEKLAHDEMVAPDSYQAEAIRQRDAIKEYEASGEDGVPLTAYDIKQREVNHESPITPVANPLKPLIDPLSADYHIHRPDLNGGNSA